MDYMNPSSLRPEIGWKPSGFLAGHMYAQQAEDYRQQMDMANVMKNLDIMRKNAEYQTYTLDAPVRGAKRGLDIAAHTAQTPIQGDLAQGQAVTARAQVLRAEPQARHQNWQDSTSRDDRVRGMMGDYLSALLSSGKPAPEIMMAWRDQVIPQIEAAAGGERVPPQLKNMSIDQMATFAKALTSTAPHRQKLEERDHAEFNANFRQERQLDNNIDVANIREQSQLARANQDRLTEAQRKQQEYRELVERLTYAKLTEVMATRGPQPDTGSGAGTNYVDEKTYKDIENWAAIEAIKMLRKDTPMGQADARVAQEGGEIIEMENLLGRVQSQNIPMKNNQIDMERVKAAPPNTTWKLPNGQTVRYDPTQNKFTVIDARRPSASHQIIR